MHLRRLFSALFALILTTATVNAYAELWRFALIGDTPYNDYERNELPHMLDAISAENVDFIIHAGDFKNGRTNCSDTLFDDRRAMFNASGAPFIFVPGDNEWTDCERISAGHYDQEERLRHLRKVFYPNNASLGQKRIALERQTGEFREHQRWRVGPLLFITLNVPGGNNNWKRLDEESPEAAIRTPKAITWLREGFALAKQEGLRGIVITMQADPDFKRYRSGLAISGYRVLLDTLRNETLSFAGQVLLVHGDTHWQRTDRPLLHPVTGQPINNFIRTETFGYPYMGWTKVIVDDAAPELFRFEVHAYDAKLSPARTQSRQ